MTTNPLNRETDGRQTEPRASERLEADADTEYSRLERHRSTDEAAGPPDALSPDVVFEMLKNPRRRRTLEYLVTESQTCSLGTLAEHLAALENDKPVRLLSSDERKRTYVALYQTHIPRMVEAGIVEFDRGTVSLQDPAFQLTPYLGLTTGTTEDRLRSRHLPIAAGVSVALILLLVTLLLATGA